MTGALQRHRVAVGVGAIVAVVLALVGYLAWTGSVQRAAVQEPTSGAERPPAEVQLIDQRGGRNDVATLHPDGSRTPTGLRCQRVYSAAGITSCLRLAGPGPTFELAVVDAGGVELRTVALPGVPSRTRVSSSGHIVSWTVFVTGDSYAVPGGFSTRTGVLDLRTGEVIESIEHFAATVDGEPYSAIDVNYWGVTVADDDRTFYATLASAAKTWLVRGDLVDRTVETLVRGVECPSLSPDGTRVAFKKRTERLGPWQLVVMDLATGVETPLPGTEGIDDQAAWLDDATLAYGATVGGDRTVSVYATAADGSGSPRLLAAEASSPVPVG